MCKYCEQEFKTDFSDLDKGIQIKSWIHKNKLIIQSNIGQETLSDCIKINLCPMCGRGLEW